MGEDVFRYTAADGSSFKAAWFLQVLEALANVVIGFLGMQLSGPTAGIPKQMFAISGAAQVSAKACTSLALANGLSFPVATLAKSGKMAPVMTGQLILGGAKYTLREYIQVIAIIGNCNCQYGEEKRWQQLFPRCYVYCLELTVRWCNRRVSKAFKSRNSQCWSKTQTIRLCSGLIYSWLSQQSS